MQSTESEDRRSADGIGPRLPPGFVRRDRLIGLLDSFSSLPLIILRAPAGAGKSSLAVDWLLHRGAADHAAWMTLDLSALPRSELWSEIVGAFGGPRTTLSGSAAAAILNRRRRPTTVVFDDFQHASPELVDEVAKFAQLLRRGRVMILTRAAGSIESPLRRVQAGTGVVTAEDLMLTADEAELIAHSADSAPRDTALILKATGGHLLLTRLALALPDDDSAEAVAREVRSWALKLVRPDRLDAVLRLALLPVVTGDLARIVTEDPDAGFLLQELVADGLGGHGTDGSFEFHPVIGKALRHHALSTIAEEDRCLALTAATAHMRSTPQHAEHALRLLVETGQLSELWPHFATSLTDSGATDLQRTIESLPLDVLASDSMASAISALAHSSNEAIPSGELLNIVDAALANIGRRPTSEDPEAAVYHELAVLTLLRSACRYEAASERAPRLLALTNGLAPSGRTAAKQAAWWGLLHASVTMTLAGRLNDAEKLLDEQEHDRDADRSQRRSVQRAFIHAMRGELALAARLLDDQGRDAPDSPHWTARLSITRATVQLERGDAVRARETLRSVEELTAPVREWPYAVIVTARTHIAMDPLAGIEDVDRLLRRHTGQPISRAVRDLLSSAVADLALAAGDLPRARRMVADRENRDVAMRLTAARIALLAPDQETVQDLRGLTERGDLWPRLRAQALQLLAAHLHRLGNQTSAQDALRRALAVTGGHDINLIHTLLPLGDLEALAHAAGVELPRHLSRSNHMERPLASIGLTKREAHLLLRLATSARLSDIASTEFVTLSTIKSQAASLYRKLGVTSRRDAVDEAHRRGLMDLSRESPH
ncbi:LuxR C-terminal-related transcriptional regulator [Leucobacter sp. NPDC015123]|uniref:LuxR C-terminal-related transcriptional regulator n=1 Tax=Leucobacter sp. NPDC015123 TaxID=3364129 RepID=UPI0036F45A07